MDKDNWVNRIRDNCIEVGTYKSAFDSVIDTLSSMLERRDKIADDLGNDRIDEKDIPPATRLLNTLNRDALAYWRDLGLTPAGLKKINDAALHERSAEVSPLQAALEKLA